jgi:arsenate reductase-like glutaredoxin family protein
VRCSGCSGPTTLGCWCGRASRSTASIGLADASADELLAAIAAHPILLERPILVVGDRAVVARPPERALDLL